MKPLSWIVLLLTISTFSQTPGNGVIDIDGNSYNTVIIGTQEWMKENLNVSKYSDGTIIPQVTDPTQWGNLTTGAWCYYNNDPTNGSTYGKLYNWYAVAGIHDNDPNTPNKILAPSGWHIPSDPEWSQLLNYLGGATICGNKMRSTGTSLWQSNIGATNESGFTGLPGGKRSFNFNFFGGMTAYTYWWNSSELNILNSKYIFLADSPFVSNGDDEKRRGFSVRCLKNIALNNQSFNNNSFNIYPNPAKDEITIDFGNTSNVIGGNYKIINMLGQEVLNGDLNSQQNTIELSSIKEQGIYFVKIYDSSNTILGTKKIIIQQ
jgi:uncharacterized protein (TIGR02145 family)